MREAVARTPDRGCLFVRAGLHEWEEQVLTIIPPHRVVAQCQVQKGETFRRVPFLSWQDFIACAETRAISSDIEGNPCLCRWRLSSDFLCDCSLRIWTSLKVEQPWQQIAQICCTPWLMEALRSFLWCFLPCSLCASPLSSASPQVDIVEGREAVTLECEKGAVLRGRWQLFDESWGIMRGATCVHPADEMFDQCMLLEGGTRCVFALSGCSLAVCCGSWMRHAIRACYVEQR